MFSSYPMKYELKPHLRIQAQCKVLRRSFGANFPSCCALLGPSPTISRQESKSCRTEDRVSGSSPQPSTFQEKNIHTFRQCITELDRSVTFQDTSFRDCPLVQRGWTLFTHLGSISQSQPNCYADFCLNCKKVRTTKLKMATVWPPFTTASRGTELNLVSLQMHVGGGVTVDINRNTNFNILVTLQMKGQSGSEPLE